MVDKSEKFRWLVRVGYFSRAVLYFVLGLIALTSAGRISEGTDGVFRAIEEFPAGTVILWVLVVGLVAYALFRFCSTFFDIENNGSDKHGIAKRIGHAGSAIGHLALAYSAFKFATTSSGGGSGGGAQEAAAGVISMPLGPILLGIVGLGFFGAAFSQAKKAYTGSFMHRISGQAPDMTRYLGGAGFSARAVVYAIVGISLVKSAWFSSSSDVKSLGSAVASLSGSGIWFTLVAIGLLLFGIFSLVLSRYRIIPDLDASGNIPAFRA
ncbi:DUF1206 domain-containing protein [Croceicoccus mobilis]|uniref:DUF1206 domain-containing protein n=1 Tax=Croceicoccus mobilis TaxID=1703339 RepID=A0A916Z5D9_9SPHN|nr:DUF1206 domain-containing protein [Croceicoccus mobilis]GGD75433.1 hypothetical protein GCM10010990_26310 [Croceicoccus mobilis]